ncbi:MAG TPA: crosslink repair DNA glycosylase YcaQ family protein [Gaiellaceae bacterium]|nr:crosslink repair DNA glycosylase YcaQ family protein [Gaiellaceae bacterium]
MESVSLTQLRRYVVAHQRYATRPRTSRTADVAAAIARLGCVQLDSISTVDRAHRLTLTSRLGRYPVGSVTRLLSAGRIFEYWAHEACLLPIEDYPLFKRRMVELSDRHWWGRERLDPKTEAHVLEAIRERGALPSRAFEGKGPMPGEMWNWKPAKRALEHLFAAGEVVVAGRDGFQRLYDLPERVILKACLDAPTPSEAEFRRGYALRAVQSRGALTESGIAEHCRLPGGAGGMRPIVDELVEAGLVRRVAAADGGAPVVVPARAEVDGRVPAGGVLLAPFENLLWDRAFVERVFGFRHVIEVYKREHERVYGYYVLPFLYGDRLVGRADLKTDRKESVLRVKAFHVEPGVRDSRALRDAFERSLLRLARGLRIERVEL